MDKNCSLLIVHSFGEVSEWSKEHAWKVCVRQKCTLGSNPSLSATYAETPVNTNITGVSDFSGATIGATLWGMHCTNGFRSAGTEFLIAQYTV
jgi:hypothetical protein